MPYFKESTYIDEELRQELNMVLYVPNTNFIFKYFTTLYMTLKDADTCLSYTREYEDFVDDRSTDIADIAFVQQNYLKDQIKEEAEEELRKEKGGWTG